ncbi:MAG: intermembrane transport protein PqiB [Acetobacteraceae bacterium]
MSHAEHAQGKGRERAAEFRPSRWPGFIWAVPIVALIIVGTLAVRSFIAVGPHTTVRFQTVGGIKAGQTDVEYRGVTVGHVTAVHLEPSLREMKVKLSFDSTMAGHLGPGTHFWIGGQTPSITDLSSLRSLISGPYIGVAPAPGQTVAEFVGLEEPPVVKWETTGKTFALATDNAGNVSRGAPVYFRHFQVGQVTGLQFSPQLRRFDVLITIRPEYDGLVTTRTRFWSAGAVHLNMGGTGPGLQLESVPALFTGAIAFETPLGAAGAKNGATFTLYSSQNAAEAAPGPHAVRYRIAFTGGPHGLASGAKVTLEGTPAGEVTAVKALYDPAAGAMRTLVDIALEPEQIARPEGEPWNLEQPGPQMNAMLTRLIRNGLRAQLASSTPVIGAREIALDLVPNAAPATLTPGNPPTIPAIGGAGGPNAIMAKLSQILAKINALPLPEIANNLREASAQLAKLSNSPQTTETLAHLDATIRHLDAITEQTEKQWPAIAADIRASTAEADKALAAARALLQSQSVDAGAPGSTTLPHALYELTRAAQSLRELSNYLEGHPNSVIFGRGR